MGWKGNPPAGGDSTLVPAVTLSSNGAPHPLRVLIVDEHGALTDGLRSLLRHPGTEVVGVVQTAEQAFSVVGTQAPDVILLVWAKSTLAQKRPSATLAATDHSPGNGSGGPGFDTPVNGKDHAAEKSAALVAYLTPRERQILDLLIDGASNKEIARRLSIRSNTVRTHVQNVLTKLRVHNRLGAVTLAIRQGMAMPMAH